MFDLPQDGVALVIRQHATPKFGRVSLVVGLDQTDDHAVWSEHAQRYGQDAMLRSPADVHGDQIDGLRQLDVQGVGALQHNHPRILAQTPGERTVGRVHRVNPGCTTLQEAIDKGLEESENALLPEVWSEEGKAFDYLAGIMYEVMQAEAGGYRKWFQKADKSSGLSVPAACFSRRISRM